jgi:hypothetical protein
MICFALARRSILSILAALFMSSCSGGSSSPTSPTPAPAAAGATLTVSNFTAVREGSGLRMSLQINETSGRVGATVSSILFTLSNGATGTTVVNRRVAAGSSISEPSITINDSSGVTTTATSMTAAVTFNDDGGRAGSASGTAAITSPPVIQLFTVAGVVTNDTTKAAIPGVLVSVDGGTYNGKSATTDGNGYYSIAGVEGGVVLRSSANGYTTSSRGVQVSGDTRLDFTMQAAAPVGPPAAALEYRVTGSRASLTYSNCTAGTSQVGAANLPWSFTCSSVPTGQFVYISAQNTGDSGTVTVSIYKRGVLYRTSSSTGAFVIATASGSY